MATSITNASPKKSKLFFLDLIITSCAVSPFMIPGKKAVPENFLCKNLAG